MPQEMSRFSSRVIAAIVCALISLVVWVALQTLVETENRLFATKLRSQILSQASVMRAKLEGELMSELLLTRGLVTEISGRTDITEERFHEVSGDFLTVSKHIRNIGLAKGLVLTYVHPKAGNESAIGLVYNENTNQWPAVETAINTRQTVIAGPVKLVQGGEGIISRTPVFIPVGVPASEQSYFGIVSVVIDVPALLRSSGIDQPQKDIAVALRGRNGLGSEGEAFFGEPTLFDQDPILLDINLPNGTWQLAAVPSDGWNGTAPLVKMHRAVALTTGLFFLLAVILITMEFERRKKLEIEQTKLIAELKTALQEVRVLSGLLPICASCKSVRDDKGYWQQIESYIHTHADVQFSHGICPNCIKKLYPEYSGKPEKHSNAPSSADHSPG